MTHLDSPVLLGLAGLVASLMGLAIGLYTLSKVRRVAQVQSEERRVTQELLNVDQIERDLQRVISCLSLSEAKDSRDLVTDLSLRLGAIRGTRRAIARTDANATGGEHVAIQYGFFDGPHVDHLIEDSTARLDLMTGSTRLISGFYAMDHAYPVYSEGPKM